MKAVAIYVLGIEYVEYCLGWLVARNNALRIAYCLTVFKNPEQVSRLIGRIYSPSDHFHIHVDRRVSSDERWELIPRKYGSGNVLLASRYRSARCTFELIEPILDAMDYFHGLDYDYFANLTGQCYPIRSMSAIKEELGKKDVAYMENFLLPSDRWAGGERGGLNRLRYFIPSPLGAGADEGRGLLFPRFNRNLPYHLEPYGGSFLFWLPRRFVEYVREYLSRHPRIVSFYRHSFMPGEMFFHTIVMNSPLRSEVVNEEKTYVKWPDPSSGHPGVLTGEDFHDIMRSGKMFARKFDTSIDSGILDLIDREIDLKLS